MFHRYCSVGIVLFGLSLVACATTTPTVELKTKNADATNSNSSATTIREAPVPNLGSNSKTVSVQNDPRLGGATATIGLIEFSDYQCTYCRFFHQKQYVQLKKNYIDTGVIQFFYKDLPLRMHAHAIPAAIMAYCAGEQNRFWGMHDALFLQQNRLGPELFPKLVQELKLDKTTFQTCLGGTAARKRIGYTISQARSLGFSGTPSFLLGTLEGDTLTIEYQSVGAPEYEELAQEIEKLRKPSAK